MCYSHQAAFFTICAKLLVTMVFTLTFLDVILVSDLKKNIVGSADLAKKRHGSSDLHIPIHPSQRCTSYSFGKKHLMMVDLVHQSVFVYKFL